MIVQYCSDLHLEFEANYRFLKQNPLPVVGDVLILAGDVTTFSKMGNCSDFFDYLSDNFKMTYWVPGNHEYYHSDISERSAYLRENIRSNLLLVNNCAITQDAIRFVFSTLWSAIGQLHEKQIQNSMSDFRLIKSKGACLSVTAYNKLHEESVKFLSDELSTR